MRNHKSLAVLKMATANLDSWLHSPRTVVMIIFYISFCYVVCTNHIRNIERLGYMVSWEETLYYIISNGCNITMTSILFLISISEIPPRSGYQSFMLVRSNRIKWLLAQVIYCLLAAVTAFVLTTMCVSVFSLTHATIGLGWTDNIRIAECSMLEEEALVPLFIRNNFSPPVACLIASIPTILFWFTMALVILMCSLFNMPSVGIGLYAIMLVANVVFMVEAIADIPMPIYFSTLNNIIAGPQDTAAQRLTEAMLGYAVIIPVLLFAMNRRVRTSDMVFDK